MDSTTDAVTLLRELCRGKQMMLMRHLQVTMPDGSRWEIPLSVIAKNRENHYKSIGIDLTDPKHEGLTAKAAEDGNHDYALTLWAEAHMGWTEVERFAVMVCGPKPQETYEKGWARSWKVIVERRQWLKSSEVPQ